MGWTKLLITGESILPRDCSTQAIHPVFLVGACELRPREMGGAACCPSQLPVSPDVLSLCPSSRLWHIRYCIYSCKQSENTRQPEVRTTRVESTRTLYLPVKCGAVRWQTPGTGHSHSLYMGCIVVSRDKEVVPPRPNTALK